MEVCPGCGGRNEPTARACGWCGRSFIVERRDIKPAWLLPAGITSIALLAVVAVTVALIGARSSSPRGVDAPPVSAAVPTDSEFPDDPEEPGPPSTSEATAGPEFVQIANTGGVGAYIRREPRSTAPGIAAHRDGTVLRIVGPDTNTEGRVWRQVEDQRGSRGWTPLEYLVPSRLAF